MRARKAQAIKDRPPERRMQGMLRFIRHLDAKAAKRKTYIQKQIEVLQAEQIEIDAKITDLEGQALQGACKVCR